MSVLVKGMEMPKNCAECPCRMIGYTKDHCNVLGKFIDFAVGSEGRREDCPLVPVPPHGRLIDADAMEKLMSDTVQGDIRGYPYSDTQWDMAFRWIDHQPTVIPADKDGET